MSTTLRCGVSGCDHPVDEDLLRCESCGGSTCKPHSLNRTKYVLCDACGYKELIALKLAAHHLGRLVISMKIGMVSAGDAAARSIEIFDELERWDVDDNETVGQRTERNEAKRKAVAA